MPFTLLISPPYCLLSCYMCVVVSGVINTDQVWDYLVAVFCSCFFSGVGIRYSLCVVEILSGGYINV